MAGLVAAALALAVAPACGDALPQEPAASDVTEAIDGVETSIEEPGDATTPEAEAPEAELTDESDREPELLAVTDLATDVARVGAVTVVEVLLGDIPLETDGLVGYAITVPVEATAR